MDQILDPGSIDWQKLAEADKSLRRVTHDIWQERRRQDKKWGVQNNSFDRWLKILGEETGEACKASLDAEFYMRKAASAPVEDAESYREDARDLHINMREELVQAAAVLHAMIECGDRNKWWPK